MKQILFTLAVLFSACCQANEWSKDAPHHKSVVSVSMSLSNGRTASGTGVLVEIIEDAEKEYDYGHIATAAHVVSEAGKRPIIDVTYFDKDKDKYYKCAMSRVVATDIENDVAIVYTSVPEGMVAAKVSNVNAKPDDRVEITGLGGNVKLEKLRHYWGTVSEPTTESTIYSGATLISGDSGGPVFNKKGEVVGINSGGSKWYRYANGKSYTWPARMSNADPIKRLLQQLQ